MALLTLNSEVTLLTIWITASYDMAIALGNYRMMYVLTLTNDSEQKVRIILNPNAYDNIDLCIRLMFEMGYNVLVERKRNDYIVEMSEDEINKAVIVHAYLNQKLNMMALDVNV